MSQITKRNAIIGESDGPTSVFILKKNIKLTLKQKIEKWNYKVKRLYIEKTIKPNSHSIDEVMDYIVNVYGFVELDKDEIQQEYNEMRASFIMQYASELLGEYATIPQLKSELSEDIQLYMKQLQERQQRAMEIPKEEFDIDFHKFQLSLDDINDNIHITIEKRFDYIGGGASGNKKLLKRFHRIYKNVYKYYGVTNQDIKNKSKRYEQVVRALIH